MIKTLQWFPGSHVFINEINGRDFESSDGSIMCQSGRLPVWRWRRLLSNVWDALSCLGQHNVFDRWTANCYFLVESKSIWWTYCAFHSFQFYFATLWNVGICIVGFVTSLVFGRYCVLDCWSFRKGAYEFAIFFRVVPLIAPAPAAAARHCCTQVVECRRPNCSTLHRGSQWNRNECHSHPLF